MRNAVFEDSARRVMAAGAVVGWLLAMQSGAEAQTVAAAAAANPDQELETIVVTAERRAERLQDVPITITNLSAAELKNAGVEDLGSIASITPGLRFDYAGTFAQPTIRGVGTALAVSGSGSNVGIYIDGFYSPNPEVNDFQLLNVDSIQVLKGPQGTLFGRNTTGGAILINTTKPSTDTNAIADVSYSSFDTQRYQGYFTTGLTSNLAFDVAGLFTKSDGWVHNIAADDSDAGAYQNYSVRTGLLFTPIESLSVLLRFTHTGTNDPTNLTANAYVIDGVPQVYGRFIPGTILTTDPDEVAYDHEPVVMLQHTNNPQLTVNWDFGPGTFTSYTQYRVENGETYESLDYTSFRALNILIGVRDRTFTQELLATSKAGSGFQWTTGVYYSDTYDAWPTDGQLFGGPMAFLAGSSTTVRSIAGYLDLTDEVVSNLFLTGGFRYTHDEVLGGYYTSPALPAPLSYPTLDSNRGTPRFVIRYALDPSSSVYASFSKGFKSAIYNVGGGQKNPIAPESLSAYEVGYKYAGRRLSGNFSGYWYNYKDLQVETYSVVNNVPVSLINNAATARIWGFDGDLKYQVAEGLSLDAGANYTHAIYTSFVNSPSFAECLNPTTCGLGFGIYNNTSTDASGFNMERAPRFTSNLGVTYTTPVSQGKLALSTNFYHTSKFFFDSSEQFPQNGYSTVDVRAEWTDPSSLFTVGIFGKNVTDTRYLTQVLGNSFGIGATWAPPAIYGVDFKVRMH